MPGRLHDRTVRVRLVRVRLALLDGVLEHFLTTGGVLVAMVQLGG
jgi:hypothetical protein